MTEKKTDRQMTEKTNRKMTEKNWYTNEKKTLIDRWQKKKTDTQMTERH